MFFSVRKVLLVQKVTVGPKGFKVHKANVVAWDLPDVQENKDVTENEGAVDTRVSKACKVVALVDLKVVAIAAIVDHKVAKAVAGAKATKAFLGRAVCRVTAEVRKVHADVPENKGAKGIAENAGSAVAKGSKACKGVDRVALKGVEIADRKVAKGAMVAQVRKAPLAAASKVPWARLVRKGSNRMSLAHKDPLVTEVALVSPVATDEMVNAVSRDVLVHKVISGRKECWAHKDSKVFRVQGHKDRLVRKVSLDHKGFKATLGHKATLDHKACKANAACRDFKVTLDRKASWDHKVSLTRQVDRTKW